MPAPTARRYTTTTIAKVRNGRYGLPTVSEIPASAGGSGSVTQFAFTVNPKRTKYATAKGTIIRPCTPKG